MLHALEVLYTFVYHEGTDPWTAGYLTVNKVKGPYNGQLSAVNVRNGA